MGMPGMPPNNFNGYMYPPMMYPQMGGNMNNMPMYAPPQNYFQKNNKMQPQMPYNNNMNQQNYYNNPNMNNMPMNQPQIMPKQLNQNNKVIQMNQQPNNSTNNVDEPDVKYMESLEDDMAKKDYLGEFIFKKIENHEFTKRKELTIDLIGKITGMILGIDDVNEIIEITRSNVNLSQRIEEALELLENSK